MDLIPRPIVASETAENHRVHLLLPRYGSGKIGRLLEQMIKSSPVRVKLDDLGSAVWQLCNGQRNVGEIARTIDQKFGDRARPVNERLAIFFRVLERQKLIEWVETERLR